MKGFFKKISNVGLGIIASFNFLPVLGHSIPEPIKTMRREEIQEDGNLYLEHAKAIDSDIDGSLLAHRSHRSHSSHRSHRSHSSHRSHYSSSTSRTTKSHSSTSSSSSSSSSSYVSKNKEPVAQNQSVTVIENKASTISLKVKDPDGDTLNCTIVKHPKHGVVSFRGIVATYIPEMNYTGPDSFQYKAYDILNTSKAATVQVNVTPETPVLTAGEKIITVFQNSPQEINLSGKMAESDSLKYFLAEPPKHGKITGYGSKLIYTPDKDYLGIDSFKFVVSDGKKVSPPADVAISVVEKK